MGKSTLVDYSFLVSPYLYHKKTGTNIHIIYYSFEIDRVSKEFDIAAHFMFLDYGVSEVFFSEGITNDGNKSVQMSANYLRGRLLDDNEEVIKISPEHEEMLKSIYRNRIIEIFGEYNEKGIQLSKGIVTFIEQKDNPTGLYKSLILYAEQHGKFNRVKAGKDSTRIVSYTPKDPTKFTIVITDHLRKLIPERNFKKKETVDKYIEYSVEIRNWCDFTFAHIIHLNRNMTDSNRIREAGDMLYPNSDDIKDTGNLSEDADYVFTMFSPNDERYGLKDHFGVRIKDSAGNELYPFLKSIHLVESRHCPFPQHFRVEMFGGYKSFNMLKFN